MKHSFVQHATVATVALLLTAAPGLYAQETVWQGSDNQWFSPANWSNGAPEAFAAGAIGSAIIDNGANLVVDDSGGPVGLTSLTLSHGTLDFSGAAVQLHGFGTTAEGAFPRILVDGSLLQNASLVFSNGASLTGLTRTSGVDVATTHELVAGGTAGSIGSIVIDGSNTHVSSNVRVGVDLSQIKGSSGTTEVPFNAGTGSLSVTNGATLAGTQLVVGANRGTGTALIASGAKVSYLTTAIGGHQSNSAGFPPIAGSEVGTGSMTVSGAGTIYNVTSSERPGYFIDGKPTVNIGYGVDNGELEVNNGATFNAQTITIGSGKTGSTDPVGGDGFMRVSGSGTTVNLLPADVAPYGDFMPNSRRIEDGQLHIGRYENGKLIIADGAVVNVVVGSNPAEIPPGKTYMAKTAGQVSLGLNGGHGVLQIGEGGAAGTLNFEGTIGGGSLNSEIFFNHNESDYVFSSSLGGGYISVRVESGGRTTLTGTNRHRGINLITDGTLVAGSNNAFAAVQAGQPANFIGGEVQVEEDGTLEIAAEVDALIIANNLSFDDGSTLAFTLAADATGPLIQITDGNASLAPGLVLDGTVNLNLTLDENFVLTDGYEWTFLTAEGDILGFTSAAFNINLDGFTVSQNGSSLQLSYAAIPEPSTVGLALMGGTAFLMALRRRRQA